MPTLTYICPTPDCGEVEVEADVEPGGWEGADADGNRGMWVSSYVLPPASPTACPYCQVVYTPEQVAQVDKQLEEAAEKYDLSDDGGYDYPEDDYNFERFNGR